MVDTSPAVQDQFKQLFERINHHQPLARPVVILVYSDTCPACADAKRNMTTLADKGYRGCVDFYQLTFATFRALSREIQRPPVTHVPTQLLYDTANQRHLWTGICTDQLESALKVQIAELSSSTPPAQGQQLMPSVLITGCSSGIGLALAEAFKNAGFEVWATARKAEDVDRLAASGFTARQLDVNDQQALTQLAGELEQHGRGLDVLINNAGYGAMGPLLDGGAEAMRRQFETNVFAVVGVTRALFPALRRNKGLVVNIGSVSGVLVTPFAGAYCASKAAVHALSEALRLEVAPFGIRVMEVQPGAIASQFASNAGHEAEQLIGEQSPWWPLREGIRARSRASQDKPTPAADFARDVLKAVRQPEPAALVRLGNGSRALPLLQNWLPRGLLQRVLKKRFGLDRAL